jgi:hypothetical protein
MVKLVANILGYYIVTELGEKGFKTRLRGLSEDILSYNAKVTLLFNSAVFFS